MCHFGLLSFYYVPTHCPLCSYNCRLQQLKPQWRWQLTPAGRIAHRKEYVEDVANSHSFDVILYEQLDDFRKENGVGVRGHLFVLKKISHNRHMEREEL